MRLQRLTGLEQEKIVEDYKKIIEEISDLIDILSNPSRITNLIREMILLRLIKNIVMIENLK